LLGIAEGTSAHQRGATVTGHHTIRVARVYDRRSAVDELRILVDRIWPRGPSKESADLDQWCKEIAPSTDLRRWYGHVPSRFLEFRDRYLTELEDPEHAAALAQLRSLAGQRDLALVTATRELETSQATVLAEYLRSTLS
jgi:uncharacterized protein YeaO (DUF488 family)